MAEEIDAAQPRPDTWPDASARKARSRRVTTTPVPFIDEVEPQDDTDEMMPVERPAEPTSAPRPIELQPRSVPAVPAGPTPVAPAVPVGLRASQPAPPRDEIRIKRNTLLLIAFAVFTGIVAVLALAVSGKDLRGDRLVARFRAVRQQVQDRRAAGVHVPARVTELIGEVATSLVDQDRARAILGLEELERIVASTQAP